jgi:hypothetical protein
MFRETSRVGPRYREAIVPIDRLVQSIVALSFDTWLGILAIPIGILVSWYFYRLALPLVEMSYAIQQTTLLGGSQTAKNLPGEVSIYFDQRRIGGLHKANYIFWNSGRQSIRRTDIASKLPLHILFPKPGGAVNPGILVLRASCLKTTRPENNVEILLEDIANQIRLDLQFEYFDSTQGFNLEILYEGKAGMALPQPLGTIIGGRLLGSKRKSDATIWLSVFAWFGIALAAGAAFLWAAGHWQDWYQSVFQQEAICPQLVQLRKTLTIPLLEAVGIVCAVMIMCGFLSSKFASRRQVPRQLAT